jgi:hypothetical protein
MPQYTQRPYLIQEYFNPDVKLPYGLTIEEIKAAINAVYDFFHEIRYTDILTMRLVQGSVSKTAINYSDFQRVAMTVEISVY